ncbi:unnamed protein product [Mycena citricolor]|uniref:PWWP domain-containing protein n=1 Tax=Mycena citricolor TaxID=2018698 RepID=A0AAD2HVV5_9AGAR|nr:unnamed protein product [Mycena citricolor]
MALLDTPPTRSPDDGLRMKKARTSGRAKRLSLRALEAAGPKFVGNDVVLGKMEGYPEWPGMIVNEDELAESILLQRPRGAHRFFAVRFFPEGEYCWLSEMHVKPLEKCAIEGFLTAIRRGRRKPVEALLIQAYESALAPEDWKAQHTEDEKYLTQPVLESDSASSPTLADSSPPPDAMLSPSEPSGPSRPGTIKSHTEMLADLKLEARGKYRLFVEHPVTTDLEYALKEKKTVRFDLPSPLKPNTELDANAEASTSVTPDFIRPPTLPEQRPADDAEHVVTATEVTEPAAPERPVPGPSQPSPAFDTVDAQGQLQMLYDRTRTERDKLQQHLRTAYSAFFGQKARHTDSVKELEDELLKKSSRVAQVEAMLAERDAWIASIDVQMRSMKPTASRPAESDENSESASRKRIRQLEEENEALKKQFSSVEMVLAGCTALKAPKRRKIDHNPEPDYP